MKYNGASWVNAGSPGFSTGAAQGPSIAVNGSGTPYVAFSDTNNSRKVTVMEYSTNTGSKEIGNTVANTISVFPNPSHGSFTLNLSSTQNEESHIIFSNLLGAKIKELKITTNKDFAVHLDVAPGVYFISTNIDNRCVNEKIIVE
jgi:hypothetical protein